MIRISYEGDNPGVNPFDEVSAISFSRSPEIFFYNFFLFYGVRFQYFQVFVSFLFSERSDYFLIW